MEEIEDARATRLRAGLQALWAYHGRQNWDGEDDVLGVLVRTILSQSTTKSNTTMAFNSLMDTFEGDWGNVAEAEVADVIEAIRMGGLARQKAPRIQAILKAVHGEFGDYSLDSLADSEPEAAMKTLLAYKGVGPKTARFVLMYALGMDVFPMDTHIFRILERWDVLEGSESDSAAHTLAEALLDSGAAYPAHMVLVQHGREVCGARKPNCLACPVRSWCPASESGGESVEQN